MGYSARKQDKAGNDWWNSYWLSKEIQWIITQWQTLLGRDKNFIENKTIYTILTGKIFWEKTQKDKYKRSRIFRKVKNNEDKQRSWQYSYLMCLKKRDVQMKQNALLNKGKKLARKLRWPHIYSWMGLLSYTHKKSYKKIYLNDDIL